jgi:hypothetical protein
MRSPDRAAAVGGRYQPPSLEVTVILVGLNVSVHKILFMDRDQTGGDLDRDFPERSLAQVGHSV